MFKVDIHTHILPPEIPGFKEKFGYGGFASVKKIDACRANLLWDDGRFVREIEQKCWDPDARLKDCDATGVSVQVLSTVPILFSYHAQGKHGLEVAKFLNDHIASVVSRYPKRFVGLGTIPFQIPDLAVKELSRCVKDLGFAGVQIGTHANGWNLDDERLFPVLAEAERLGAAVFVHPWDMLGSDRTAKYWLSWLVGMPAETSLAICSLIFGGVLDRLPKLRIAFAHGGGSFPGTIGRIEQGFHARPDLCQVNQVKNPMSYVKKLYFDTCVHEQTNLKQLIEIFGVDRLAMGSDYPFPLGEARPGKLIESLSLDTKSTGRLLSGTALEWLGRKETDF